MFMPDTDIALVSARAIRAAALASLRSRSGNWASGALDAAEFDAT
jgi:hypothetical protein